MKSVLWIAPSLLLLCLLSLASHPATGPQSNRSDSGTTAARVASLPSSGTGAAPSSPVEQPPVIAPEADAGRPGEQSALVKPVDVQSDAAGRKAAFLQMRAYARKLEATTFNWPDWLGQVLFEQYYFPSDSPSSAAVMDYFRAQQNKTLTYAQARMAFYKFGNDWLRNVIPADNPDDPPSTVDAQMSSFLINRIKHDYAWFPEISVPLDHELASLQGDNVGPNDPRWDTLLFNGALERIEIASGMTSPQELRESAQRLNDVYGKDGTWNATAVDAECQDLQKEQAAAQVAVGADFDAGNKALRTYAADNLAVRRQIWYGLRDTQQATVHVGLVDPKPEWEDEWRVMQREMTRPEWYASVAPYTYNAEALTLPTDRDPADIALRRTNALLTELEQMTADTQSPILVDSRTRLTQLQARLADIDPSMVDARKAAFMEVCALRRKIAFANPLLNFDKIVFVKHNQPALYTRAHHQFLGQYTGDWSNGGLFELQSPFSDNATVTDILTDSKCQNGPKSGQPLRGSFHTPIVSYDGSDIYFAYCEPGIKDEKGHPVTGSELNQYQRYHLFRVRPDGSDLTQLTFGPHDDFDPCETPDGSLIFSSTRRGGYTMGDTTGNTPVFTLFRTNQNTGQVFRLSPHVDHEWDPVIAHDGDLIYTRWDIWDRGYTSGMGLFRSTPDGRDPRSIVDDYRKFNGFLPGSPPNQIMDARPVPENDKLMASAISYFDPSYGSVILIDPSRPDDGLDSCVKRLTPDQWFPSEEYSRNEGPMQYGTPWPLSEKFFLCVYDSRHDISQGSSSNFGIYLVDAFGNKELLYRDPSVSCFRPVPLRAQPVPPQIPDQIKLDSLTSDATALPSPAAGSSPATVGVINVNDSRYPFPADMKPSRLRIVEALPKTTPAFEKPAMGYGSNKGGRIVLGTVPIEADGSVYFQMPAQGTDAPIYFQVLDDHGIAIQGMRELTTVKPGEQLYCQGCHEPRAEAPPLRAAFPIAFQRKPSLVEPEAGSGQPLTFARLVQPILDQHCISCHGADAAAAAQPDPEQHVDVTANTLDLRQGDWKSDPNHFYTSYKNLEKYVQCFKLHIGEQEETMPGKFGARVSKLYIMLQQGHQDVKLSDDEMRRIALWIDTNCRFYGTYDDTEAQAQGDSVPPTLR